MHTAIIVPNLHACAALSNLPAPMFCALIVDMDMLKAITGINTKPLNLPTAPTAADALIPPAKFTIAVRNKNEMLTTPFWTADGNPILNINLSWSLYILKDEGLKSK